MKVKLKTPRCGNSFVQERGDIIDVPEAEGQRMLAKGHAERVTEDEPKGHASQQPKSRS